MNSLSFCENKYYTNAASSIQFLQKCSQFPGIYNATRGKCHGSTRINQPVFLTINRNFRPDADDRL